MTLSARNFLFKAGIVFSLIWLGIGIIASIQAMPVYAFMDTETIRRHDGIFQILFGSFLDIQLLAVNFSILALSLYSFFTILFISYFFEKTQSPEILFVVIFAASFSPEVLRLLLPLGQVYQIEIPSLYSLMTSRILLFFRHFGIFSLFAASLIAVGYKVQMQRNVIMFIMVATLIVALGVPIDTQTWDSSLNMIYGYLSMFRLIEVGTFLITAISFFIAAWLRNSREFIFIGIGSVLVFLGRNIMLHTDAWVGLPLGLAPLAAGTWLMCINLHKKYLWY